MSKVVVFGGSGFLGSHVADVLTEREHIVSIYDINTSNYIQEDQKMLVGDILNGCFVNKVVERADIVYNFAGLADLDESHKKPFETIEKNIIGNSIILEACRKANVKRYIFASTVYVYSDSGSFYRVSKLASEMIIKKYHEEFGIPYTILRYGSLYGPRSQENNFIYKLLKEALNEQKIVRKGDGEDIREYIHVRDAAKLSVDILDDKYKNQCINITGIESIKIRDLFVMVKEIIGGDIKFVYKDPEKNHHYRITPYKFNALMPDEGKKLISDCYHDFGQGLIEMLCEIKKVSK